MKNILFVTVALLIACTAGAQETDEIKTLFSKDARNGGYFGLDFQYGEIEDHNVISSGVRMSWIMAHNLGIGLAANGFFSDFSYDNYEDEYHNLQGGSAGLIVEPIIGAKWPVHLSVPLYFGVGGATYTTSNHDYFNDPVDYHEDYEIDMYYEDYDMYLTFKPGVEVELNVLKFFRLGLGAYYNFTTDLNLPDVGTKGLNGWQTGISLKFGRF